MTATTNMTGPIGLSTADGLVPMFVESYSTIDLITTLSARREGDDELDHWGGINESVSDADFNDFYAIDDDPIIVTDSQVAQAVRMIKSLELDNGEAIDEDSFLEIWQDVLGLP
jgi:hypothetical protein